MVHNTATTSTTTTTTDPATYPAIYTLLHTLLSIPCYLNTLLSIHPATNKYFLPINKELSTRDQLLQ